MEDFGEIKLVEEDEEILLKLYDKKSATYFSIWLTFRGIDYRFIFVRDEDDFYYDPDEEDEYLFWMKKDDWNNLKDEIRWEED